MADTMLQNSISSANSAMPTPRSSGQSTLSRIDLGRPPTYRTISASSTSSNAYSILTPSSSSNPSSTVFSASSITRERLRLAELKLDDLTRALKEERALSERLKREGHIGDTALSTAQAEHKLRELKRDTWAAEGETANRNTKGMFKEIFSTDLMFLIDTTGSMQGYIDTAKAQVLGIVEEIKREFLQEAEVRIAVVGYKDHGDSPNIEFLDFTPNANEVQSFIGKLRACGGADRPEDVLGGIQQALNATWKHETRSIIHIGDSPPHGRTNHNFSATEDHYPVPGSEPHGLLYTPLLTRMISLNINYAFCRILPDTDRMTCLFFNEYTASSAQCSLSRLNQYYNWASSKSSTFQPRGQYSQQKVKGGLIFREVELGTTYNVLRDLVVKAVASSASQTAVRASAARTTRMMRGLTLGNNLASIREDAMSSSDISEASLETASPQWNVPGWLDETILVEGFSPDIAVHGASTLDSMMANDDNFKMSVTNLTIQKRTRPFGQGAQRTAFYARTANSTSRFVVKSFKRSGKRMPHLVEDMRCQALCKSFALEFNAFSRDENSIDFLVTTGLKAKSKPDLASPDIYLSLEPFIEGTYVKYNSNMGYVNDEVPSNRMNQVAQAFSHFTFERSQGLFLVSDLQGVGSVLTDPAIHTRDQKQFKLADSNLGEEGFKFFFATHVCNDICQRLQLKTNKAMITLGKYDFRKIWPLVNDTTCCANVLCGRILRVSNAKRSDKYPRCNWCHECWPQLDLFNTRLICVAPGPHHEFEVSRFFYESQGLNVPRKCPKHRGIADVGGRVTVETANFWTKTSSGTRTPSYGMTNFRW